MDAPQLQNFPDPDQYNPELPSPFDSLPLHLLANVFAQITDVGSKIRLSRVCHRFRDCIQMEESWRFNTELNSQQLIPQSALALMEHAPLKSLDLNLADKCGWMSAEMLEQAAKLRLTRLRVSSRGRKELDPGVLLFLDQCAQNSGPTLTHLRVELFWQRCDTTFLTNLFAKCSALEDIYICDTSVDVQRVILSSLKGKPPRNLEINNRHPTVAYKLIAALSAFDQLRSENPPPYRDFTFAHPIDFFRGLELSAALALKKISLWFETTEESTVEFVRDLPSLLPNVEQVAIACYLSDMPSDCFGFTKAFKQLLDSAEHRPHPISLKFSPLSTPQQIGRVFKFGSSGVDRKAAVGSAMMDGWFDAFSAEFGSSSDYGDQIHTGSPWKRIISKGQATVTLIYYV